MSSLRGIISIIRLEDGILGAFGVWMGWVVAANELFPSDPFPMLLSSLSIFFLVGGLNIWNDMEDIDIDKLIHNRRALPSGRISFNFSKIYLCSLLLLSASFAITASVLAGNALLLVIYLVGITLSLLYEKRLKEKGLLGNLTIAIMVFLPILLGASITGINLIVGILCLMVFITSMAKEIINSVMDIEGDRGFRKTLPQTIGVNNALLIAAILLLIDITLSATPMFMVGFSIPYVIFIGVADLILVSVIITSFKRPVIAHYLHNAGMVVSMPGFLLLSIPIPVFRIF